MSIATRPNTSQIVAEAKESADKARHRLLATFEFVPDDKLTWSPSNEARSALEIVGHCGRANQAFAAALRGEELQLPETAEEASAMIRAAGKDVKTRAEAVQLIQTSTDEVLEALDRVTDDLIETSPMSPFGPFPYTFWMSLPGIHMGGHANQIDYIQTIWGDHEDHF